MKLVSFFYKSNATFFLAKSCCQLLLIWVPTGRIASPVFFTTDTHLRKRNMSVSMICSSLICMKHFRSRKKKTNCSCPLNKISTGLTDAIKSNKILIFVIILILNFPLLELRAAVVSNECDNPIISISQFNQAAVSHDYLIIIQKRREIVVFSRLFSASVSWPYKTD